MDRNEAWARIKDVLEAISAKTEAGPCVTHVGPDGAGHFVKMVHNGIEYGDMQLIAEAYDVLHRGLGLTTPEAGGVFEEWNRGPLESFLIELTAHVCRVIDPETRQPLVDVIQDKAGQKGTGKWTAQIALDLAVAIPTIGAAIDARVLSSLKEQRVAAGTVLGDGISAFAGADREGWKHALRDALFAARVQLRPGHGAHCRRLREVRLERQPRGNGAHLEGGCIIRARLLDPGPPGVHDESRAGEPAGRSGDRARHAERRARLAPRRRRGRVGRDPGARAGREPRLLRQLSHRAAAAEPHAGAARRLRRASSNEWRNRGLSTPIGV